MSNRNGPPPHGAVARPANFGRPPNRFVRVPPEYRRVTLFRESERLAHLWKIETNCEVVSHWDHSKIVRFDVYGSGSNLDKAERQINDWILNANTKSKESSAWAKCPAFDNDKWYYKEVQEMERERKQMFKHPIPEGLEVPYKIVVDWPKDLGDHSEPVIPKDVFGTGLEALDTIRMDDEVWITPLDLRRIEISGFDIARVDSAEQHYFTMIQKARTSKFAAPFPLHMILDDREGMDVLLEEVERWWPNRTSHGIVPRLIYHPMMNIPGAFRQDGLHFTDLSTIQRAIQLALESARYEKGYYDFCIRYGCFALSSEKMPHSEIGKNYPKEHFLKALETRIDSEAKKWLFPDKEGDRLLARLVAAGDLLEPTKSAGFFGYKPPSLDETRPMLRGTWVFHDPNARIVNTQVFNRHPGRPGPQKQESNEKTKAAPTYSLIVVQIDWTDDEEGVYEKMEPRYFQLRPGHAGPKQNMDIKLLELGEGRAWQFSLESMTPLSKKLVSPALRGFADQVQMKLCYDMHSKEGFAEWPNIKSLKIHTGRLDKIYTFGIQKTGYKVEAVSMWYPQQRAPCWGINVRHSEWATHLCELERLPVGRAADWGDTVSTFLPDNGLTSSVTQENGDDLGVPNLRLSNNIEPPPRDGIRLLMEKLMKLSEVVNSSGGVTIGNITVETHEPKEKPKEKPDVKLKDKKVTRKY